MRNLSMNSILQLLALKVCGARHRDLCAVHFWWLDRLGPENHPKHHVAPGWNAIHMEVEPTAGEPSPVFGGWALNPCGPFRRDCRRWISFRTRVNRSGTAHPGASGFRRIIPGAFQNSLFKILGNRPYLVNLTNTTPVTSVCERDVLRFGHSNGCLTPTICAASRLTPRSNRAFATFFRSSPAHFNASSAQLKKIYRLSHERTMDARIGHGSNGTGRGLLGVHAGCLGFSSAARPESRFR